MREFSELLTLSALAIAWMPVASYVLLLPNVLLSLPSIIPQSPLDDKFSDVMELLTRIALARYFAPPGLISLLAILHTKPNVRVGPY